MTAERARLAELKEQAKGSPSSLAAKQAYINGLEYELDAAERERDEWKHAVLDAAVVNWTYTAAMERDPRVAVNALLAWESQVALDPAVSEQAAKLHARIQSLEQERDRLREAIEASGSISVGGLAIATGQPLDVSEVVLEAIKDDMLVCLSGCLRNHGCPHDDVCDCDCTCGAQAVKEAVRAYRAARTASSFPPPLTQEAHATLLDAQRAALLRQTDTPS